MAYLFAGIWKAIWLPFVVMFAHALIDGFKCSKKDNLKNFICDQLLHILVLILCFLVLFKYNFSDIDRLFVFGKKFEFWLFMFSYFFVLWPASILINKFTEPWQKELNQIENNSLRNAGLWIGRIEIVFILTFHPQPQTVY